MSRPLLLLLALIEVCIVVSFLAEGKHGLALVWSCYVVANFGFMFA